jgi:glucose dehydrogenase
MIKVIADENRDHSYHGQSDWPASGDNLTNTRYSALDEINLQNVTTDGFQLAADAHTG